LLHQTAHKPLKPTTLIFALHLNQLHNAIVQNLDYHKTFAKMSLLFTIACLPFLVLFNMLANTNMTQRNKLVWMTGVATITAVKILVAICAVTRVKAASNVMLWHVVFN
jgi:hypothetical protein